MIKIDPTPLTDREAHAKVYTGLMVLHGNTATFYRKRPMGTLEKAPAGSLPGPLSWTATPVFPGGPYYLATEVPDEAPATVPTEASRWVIPPEGYISATESEARDALAAGREVWEETERLWWRREGPRFQFRTERSANWNNSRWQDPVDPRHGGAGLSWRGAWFVRETSDRATPIPPYRADPKRRIWDIWCAVSKGDVVAFVPAEGATEFYRRRSDPSKATDFQRYHHSGESWRPCATPDTNRRGAWYVAEDCHPKPAAPQRSRFADLITALEDAVGGPTASGTTTGTAASTLTITMGRLDPMPDRVVLAGPTGRNRTEYVRARDETAPAAPVPEAYRLPRPPRYEADRSQALSATEAEELMRYGGAVIHVGGGPMYLESMPLRFSSRRQQFEILRDSHWRALDWKTLPSGDPGWRYYVARAVPSADRSRPLGRPE